MYTHTCTYTCIYIYIYVYTHTLWYAQVSERLPLSDGQGLTKTLASYEIRECTSKGIGPKGVGSFLKEFLCFNTMPWSSDTLTCVLQRDAITDQPKTGHSPY